MFHAGRVAAGAIAVGFLAWSLTGCQSGPVRVVQLPAPASVSASAPVSTSVSPAPTDRPTPSPSARPSTRAPSAGAPPSQQRSTKIDYVVAISVDGLNPDAIGDLGRSGAPTFYRLIDEGAGTLNARTEQEHTRTLPNHTGMLTGRWVDGSDGHGYTRNTDTGSTVHATAGHYVSSVFDVVHDSGRSTALFAAKQKFAVFDRTWNRDGAMDRTGRNDGSAKIDRFVTDTDNDRLTTKITDALGNRPADFTFVHLAAPDEAGHQSGFMSESYLQAVAHTDKLIGKVLKTVQASANMNGHTVVVVTADHGGRGPSHDDATKLDNYRIPFLVWGAGVPEGGDLYRMNPDYLDPGIGRPDYLGRQPVRNGDVANLVTDLFGLPRVPGSELDRRQDLDVSASR